jgi:hypothetical protein
MPPLPTEGDLPEGDLGAAVVALAERVAALNRHMEFLVDEKVQTKVETEVAAKGVPREEYTRRVRASGKRVIAGFVAVLLLIVVAVGLNRLTLQQAQRDLNDQIVGCFLRPGDNTPAEAQACTKRFGNGYTENQQRSRDALTDFVDLRRWAKERGWQPPSEQ